MTLLLVMAAISVPHPTDVVEPRKAPCVGACRTRHRWRVQIRGLRGKMNSIAACESGGNWSISTGNSFYGGLQFTLSSWQAVGGSGYPHNATKLEQMYRGVRLSRLQGWGAWPNCA